MYLSEARIIDTEKVRAMCIRNNYYTSGTNEDYQKMFQKCGLNFGVLAIASDIFEHSDKEKLVQESGCSKKEVLENICFELINDCSYTCVSIEE